MKRITTIICAVLLAANGVVFFSNLWKTFHGNPEIAYFAAFNFIAIGCMYIAIAVLTIDIEN